MSYPAAPIFERQTLQQLALRDTVNVELLQRYGQATELPQTEQGERMRARYGR